MAQQLRIGMFGGGVVGGGVYKLLEEPVDGFASPGKVVKICVRDATKERDFSLKEHTELVTDPEAILEDDSIDCVVELMGGTSVAKDVVFKALEKGKRVVTANKALLAKFLPEIEERLRKYATASLGYEAAVCGGIPIIRALQEDFVSDDIESVAGIMNGTTNFILSKMEAEGANFADVLAEAQKLGYAEADPTADVEGHDVQAKISLLAKLAFGQTVPMSSISCYGISNVSAEDFKHASIMGKTIKLLGVSSKTSSGGISVYVVPTLVPKEHVFASAKGAGNIVVVRSKNMGESSLSGPGAGRFPTANSVVNDIARVALGTGGQPFPRKGQYNVEESYEAEFYIRFQHAFDSDTLKAKVWGPAEERGIELSVLSCSRVGEGGETLAALRTSRPVSNVAVAEFCGFLQESCNFKDPPFFMRIA